MQEVAYGNYWVGPLGFVLYILYIYIYISMVFLNCRYTLGDICKVRFWSLYAKSYGDAMAPNV